MLTVQLWTGRILAKHCGTYWQIRKGYQCKLWIYFKGKVKDDEKCPLLTFTKCNLFLTDITLLTCSSTTTTLYPIQTLYLSPVSVSVCRCRILYAPLYSSLFMFFHYYYFLTEVTSSLNCITAAIPNE